MKSARRARASAATTNRTSRSALPLVVALAAILKLIILLQFRDHPLLEPREGLDNAVYLDLARRVVAGDFLGGTQVFFVSPLYIYFVALGLAFSGGSVLVVQLIQILLGAASVWFIGDLARTRYGEAGGVVAASLAALTGFLTFNEILLLQSSLDGFLTAGGLWTLHRAWQTPSGGRFLAAGLLLGLHTLNRPNVGIWVIAVAVLTVSLSRFRRSPKPTLALVGGVALAIAPVTIRNYAISGHIAFVSSHGGLNFYIGNHADADGTYRRISGITPSIAGQQRDMTAFVSQRVGHPVNDVQASSWFYSAAWRWIGEHPGEALRLFGRKLGLVLSSAHVPLNDSYAYFAREEPGLLQILIVGPWLLFPLGIAGLWLGWSRGTRDTAAVLLPAFIATYTLSIALFFVADRYRLPLFSALCVTSAGSIVTIAQALRQRNWQLAVKGIFLIAVFAVFVNWPRHIDDGRAAWQSEMIVRHIEAGRDAQAEALLSQIEPTHPNVSLLRFRTAKAYLSIGRHAAALPHLLRSHELASDRPEIRFDLGQVLLDQGRAIEAIPHLRAALQSDTHKALAAPALVTALRAGHQSAAAIGVLRDLQTERNLDAQTDGSLGRLSLELGDHHLAVFFLERSVRRAPENAATQAALGITLGLIGRREDGVRALEHAARLDPANAATRLNLAVAYADLGRIEDAKREATEALRLRPNYDRAREFLKRLGR